MDWGGGYGGWTMVYNGGILWNILIYSDILEYCGYGGYMYIYVDMVDRLGFLGGLVALWDLWGFRGGWNRFRGGWKSSRNPKHP